MRVQISSGQGPAECELAVAMLYEELRRENGDVRLVSCMPGKKPGCMSSVVFETDRNLRELEGSVLWICKSPYRPGHKRKNWYVDVSILDQVPRISEERMVRFETFCSGGKGGQQVKKVETGVRLPGGQGEHQALLPPLLAVQAPHHLPGHRAVVLLRGRH